MTDQEIEFLLYRIISGKQYFTYDNKEYCLFSPSNEVKYNALRIYFDIIEEEKFNGWLRESVLHLLLIGNKCWSTNTKIELINLEKSIDKNKKELYKNRMNNSLVSEIRRKLESTRKRIEKINRPKNELYQYTLEGYANNIKNEYIISNCLFCNGQKVFNFNEQNTLSFLLFNGLINASNEASISVSDIRLLSKSSLWRAIWSCNRHNPFGVDGAINLTNDQKVLINFSFMYDSVYDHTERPEDFVIDDDDMLDGWMLYIKDKISQHRSESQISKTHKNAQEVFLMAGNSEDLEKISDMNSDIGKSIIKSRLNQIQNSNQTISDSELPDIAQEIDSSLLEKSKSRQR